MLSSSAFRAGVSQLISLRGFAAAPLLQTSCIGQQGSALWGAAANAGAQLQQQQCRGVVSEVVRGNKVARAMRALNRKMYGDDLLSKWRAKQYFVKPAKQRFEARKETAVRLQKAEFREKLRWAMQRKARGF